MFISASSFPQKFELLNNLILISNYYPNSLQYANLYKKKKNPGLSRIFHLDTYWYWTYSNLIMLSCNLPVQSLHKKKKNPQSRSGELTEARAESLIPLRVQMLWEDTRQAHKQGSVPPKQPELRWAFPFKTNRWKEKNSNSVLSPSSYLLFSTKKYELRTFLIFLI